MPRISDMMPSKYLKASDFEESTVVTMSHVKQDTVGQGAEAEKKWILYFEENEKGLVLNKTNANTIAALYGDDSDDWEGKKITLFSTQVDYQGKQVDAIRVRNKLPKAKKAEEAKPAKAAPVAAPADDSDSDDPPF